MLRAIHTRRFLRPTLSSRWLRHFSLPSHVFLEMPALSPTMSHGKIASWSANIGDAVNAGAVYCEVETDKATVSYDAQEDGFLAKILVPASDSEIEVGTKIGIVVDDLSDVAAFANYDLSGASAAPAPEPEPTPVVEATPEPEPESRQPSIQFRHGARESAAPTTGRIKASPFAKTIALELGVDLRVVQGTGPGGRIVAEDVRAAAKAPKAAPVVAAAPTPTPEPVMEIPMKKPATPTPAAKPATVTGIPYVPVFDIPHRTGGNSEDLPLSGMRKIIAQRLTESKMSIPHYYVTMECELDNMMKLRSSLNKALEKSGGKLSVNDFIIKSSSYALLKVPETNMMWQGDSLKKNDFVDISVAVDVGSGLITPIVRDVQGKGLMTISNEVKDFVKRAKENKLVPSDYQGGTFTISNMGMFGVKNFTAIINPPQSCILAVSAAQKVLKPADNEAGFRTATVMNVTLSSDHRVVDGATAARWCNAFKEAIETPELLIL